MTSGGVGGGHGDPGSDDDFGLPPTSSDEGEGYDEGYDSPNGDNDPDLDATWARRIDAAQSVEQIRALEFQELQEMQNRAAQALNEGNKVANAGGGARRGQRQQGANKNDDKNDNDNDNDNEVDKSAADLQQQHTSAMESIQREYQERLQRRLQTTGFAPLAQNKRFVGDVCF